MNKNLYEYIDDNNRFDYVPAVFRLCNDIKINKECGFSELDRNIKGNLFMVPFCSFGDFDNSCAVERSNHRVFLEIFGKLPGVYAVTGGYGSNGIVIDIELNKDNQEIIDIIAALANYPAINDDDVSNLEMEMEKEAFDDTYKSELSEAIEVKIKELTGNEDFELSDNVDLWKVYCELSEKTNSYCQIECGGNVYIDIDRLMTGFVPEMLTDNNQVSFNL
jgi:hypothetical protein